MAEGSLRAGQAEPSAAKDGLFDVAVNTAPIASVVVDVNAVAVDRPFDFLVPDKFDSQAKVGTRVRVRFRGKLTDGVIVRRSAETAFDGRLTPVSRVQGPAVFTPEVLELASAVCDRYAGTMSEVLRDAAPARVARVEKDFGADTTTEVESNAVDQFGAAPDGAVGPQAGSRGSSRALESESRTNWSEYHNGEHLLTDLRAARQRRVALTVALADDAAQAVADLVIAAHRRAIVVVPDTADIHHFAAALLARCGPTVAVLAGTQTPADRYREYLRVLNGEATVVVGTRSSVFAPVASVELLVVWDDLDDSLLQPRSPGWHAREVAALRSLHSDASVVLAARYRSLEVQKLVEIGWLREVVPTRQARHRGPRVVTAADAYGDDPALQSRLPRYAWDVIQHGLARGGPVLVQVGRAGYLPALACGSCREVATCEACGGPLGQASPGASPTCRWCGRGGTSAGSNESVTSPPPFAVFPFTCRQCGGHEVRAVRVGSSRTAEELAAAFPDESIIMSDSHNGVLEEVEAIRQIVVSTIGAEPRVAGGYAAAVLLDGDAQLAFATLRTDEQQMRRWSNALALVRSSASGGRVAITADPGHRVVQALVRADPVGWAQREFGERRELNLPPAARSLTIVGPPDVVEQCVSELPTGAASGSPWRVLGPTPTTRPQFASFGSPPGPAVQVVVLAPTADGRRLAEWARRLRAHQLRGSGTVRLSVRLDSPTAL